MVEQNLILQHKGSEGTFKKIVSLLIELNINMDNAINALLIALATIMFNSINLQYWVFFFPCAARECHMLCLAVPPGTGEQEVIGLGEGKGARLCSGLSSFTCPQVGCVKPGSLAWLDSNQLLLVACIFSKALLQTILYCH